MTTYDAYINQTARVAEISILARVIRATNPSLTHREAITLARKGVA
jgi:hypothetical protein